jgi:Domain of unknown function (DUF5666)
MPALSQPLSTARRRPWWLGTALSAVLALSACGGGGSSSDTPAPSSGTAATPSGASAAASPTATAYASGAITGLGSIIVNGVRYDDSSARVLGDDDSELRDDRRRLKLGMQVDVASGTVDDSTGRARAESVRVGSELMGAVERVTLDAGGALQSFVLLGQTVLIQRPGTVVDDSLPGGLAGITVGRLLEVHATFNGTAYVASFIELRSAAAVSRFKVRGVVSALDTTARTFRIGSTSFSYAGLGADALSVTLTDGLLVRVEVANGSTSGGVLQALSVRPGRRASSTLTASAAVADARLRGAITKAVVGAVFELNGTPVQVDTSTRFDKGSLASLVLGVVVEVRGVLQGGSIIASRITVRGADDRSSGNGGNSNSNSNGGGTDDIGGIELHGTASAIDLAAKRFTLTHAGGTSYAVSYTGDFDAIVSSSPKLEVKGTLSADGRSIVATLIKRED